MRSLIQAVGFFRLTMLFLLIPVCGPAFAGVTAAGAMQAFLEEPKIVAVGGEGEIHIGFDSDIRLIRHTPEKTGDVLRIFIEVSNPCVAEKIVTQESRWLPPADWYIPVSLTFPELIGRPGAGPDICPLTNNHADVAKTLRIKFGKVTNFKVRMGPNKRSLVIVVPLLKQQPDEAKAQPVAAVPAVVAPVKPQPEVESPPVPVSVSAPEPDVPPVDLLASGRAALAAGDSVKATQIFNKLLRLPPNEYSQEAQEMVGVAREASGEIAKAKAEYQLYLKLFPEGEGTVRVKQRLARLESLKGEAKQDQPKTKPRKAAKEIHQNTVTGSVSQYFYGGASQNETDNYGLSRVTGQNEVTKTKSNDQSSIITNLDATARFRHNQYDTKVVFRDTQSHTFFGDLHDKNTVSAAYIEHQNKELDYMVRLGRQSGTSQGVLGRFDGAFARYGLNPQWKLTAVVGRPDDGSHNTIQTDRHFYGAAVEFGPLAEKWSGNVYAIQQVADDIVERRAIGTELRYFNGTTSWFGTVDYDTIYDMVNIAMLQGNWMAFDGYNFNLLLDHRKSPILYGETALQVGPFTYKDASGNILTRSALSIHDLLTMETLLPPGYPDISKGDIYDYVRALVPDSDMVMLGVTKQVSDRWQLGGDIRINNTYQTDGVFLPAVRPNIPPSTCMTDCFDEINITKQDGTGYIYTYTLQAIGTNTLFKDDTSVIMASFVNDPTFNAQNLSYANSVSPNDKWRLDSSLRYYHENSNMDVTTWKMTPGLRVNYHWRDNMSFEAEASVEFTRTHDPVSGVNIETWRENLFVGYRWDFR